MSDDNMKAPGTGKTPRRKQISKEVEKLRLSVNGKSGPGGQREGMEIMQEEVCLTLTLILVSVGLLLSSFLFLK